MSSISQRSIGASQTEVAGSWTAQRSLVVASLTMGWALGLGGSVAPAGTAQDLLWSISSLGLITGALLLALRFAQRGHEVVTVGFVLVALGEVVILSGGTPTDPGSVASFAAGTALYSIGLPLVSFPSALPVWARVPGALAIIPFAANTIVQLTGGTISPTGPLASAGYMLLTLAMISWTVLVMRRKPTDR